MPTRSGRAAPLPAQERREAIVVAVAPLVREHGLAVTTGQIARAAGVAEGTIFRVFADKESLVWAVVDAALDTTSLARRISDIPTGDPLDARLGRAVELTQEHLSGLFTLIGAVGMQRPHPSGDHGTARMAESERVLSAAMVGLLEPHAAELARPPAEVARVVRLLTFAATHPRVAGGPPMVAAEIVSLALDGVRDHAACCAARPDCGRRPEGAPTC